jgi:hypothetical protein
LAKRPLTATVDIAGPFKFVGQPLVIQPKGGRLTNSGPVVIKPVVWWKLDETQESQAMDASGQSHTARVQGAAHWSPGQGHFGGALEFDGATNFLETDAAGLDFREGLTFALWIKPQGTNTGKQAILAKGLAGWQLRSSGESGKLAFLIDGSQDEDAEGSDVPRVTAKHSINDGQWHHVAGVWDGKRIALYVDGALEQSEAVSGSIPQSTDPLWVGRNPASGQEFFVGLLDDIRIYAGALAPEVIKTLSAQKAE